MRETESHPLYNVIRKHPQGKTEEWNHKKRPAEPESDAPDDVETDIEGVISDYEKGNYGDKFITVEKKQIRIPNL